MHALWILVRACVCHSVGPYYMNISFQAKDIQTWKRLTPFNARKLIQIYVRPKLTNNVDIIFHHRERTEETLPPFLKTRFWIEWGGRSGRSTRSYSRWDDQYPSKYFRSLPFHLVNVLYKSETWTTPVLRNIYTFQRMLSLGLVLNMLLASCILASNWSLHNCLPLCY